MLRVATLLALCGTSARAIDVVAHRPDASGWKRTQCGGPKGKADIPSKWAAEVSPAGTPLPAYPRPQMVRGSGSDFAKLRDAGDPAAWANLNGLWEWEKAETDAPAFGKTLNGSILVPFPVESCLSGVAPTKTADLVKTMWYRLTFDHSSAPETRTLLHFGAVDWQTTVYLNTARLGNHTGGFDGFSFDISDHLTEKANELLVYVYDPSDHGPQPNGKQRSAALDSPGGDTYTPSSGIWQTVWLESVPTSYISSLEIDQASETAVTVTVQTAPSNHGTVGFAVMDDGVVIKSGSMEVGKPMAISVPDAKLWSPDSPKLYNLKLTAGGDSVLAYFGLRTFVLGTEPVPRPLLNQKFTFMAGFLDQSFWPDGLFTAPTDEALEFDLIATKSFGLNMIRLHQKVNPERWYYHADRHGLVLFQDMPQKYGGASEKLIPYFVDDLKAMIQGRKNHPCIVQWTAFNEEDCWKVFTTKPYDVLGITQLAKQLDPTRLVDTNSGGGATKLGYADVNDIHSYPYPGDPHPNHTQYAMVGEFGGLGAFIKGREWIPGGCYAYLKVNSSQSEADIYATMAKTLLKRADHISASVYTQTTDVECECDGFLNYDRTSKFNESQTKVIYDANRALVEASSAFDPMVYV